MEEENVSFSSFCSKTVCTVHKQNSITSSIISLASISGVDPGFYMSDLHELN